jgi:hypothetical protein
MPPSIANQIKASLALADLEVYLKDMPSGLVTLLKMNLSEENPPD